MGTNAFQLRYSREGRPQTSQPIAQSRKDKRYMDRIGENGKEISQRTKTDLGSWRRQFQPDTAQMTEQGGQTGAIGLG